MGKRYYLAYGSNLNLRQMRMRCPQARILGTAELREWELLFRGSGTGAYLTIGHAEDGTVPVAVWEVTEADERALDRYEGYPRFYYKKEMRIQCKGIRTGRRRSINAFVYIMHEEFRPGVPEDHYMDVCMEGYDDFRFDKGILENAYEKSREACSHEG